MSKLLKSLSYHYDKCYFVSSAKLFVREGEVREEFFMDGIHLNWRGARKLSDEIAIQCQDIYEKYKK